QRRTDTASPDLVTWPGLIASPGHCAIHMPGSLPRPPPGCILALGSWSGPWPVSEAAHRCPESTLGLSSARMAELPWANRSLSSGVKAQTNRVLPITTVATTVPAVMVLTITELAGTTWSDRAGLGIPGGCLVFQHLKLPRAVPGHRADCSGRARRPRR